MKKPSKTSTDPQLEKVDLKMLFDKTNDFALLEFKGIFSKEQLQHCFKRFLEHPDFKYNMNAVLDFTHAFSELEMFEIEEFGQFVERNKQIRGETYKLALVANDTLNIALLEVYKLLVSKTSIEVEVFTQVSKAISWVSEQAFQNQ